MAKQKTIRIGLIADPQYSDLPASSPERSPGASLEKLKDIVAHLNTEELDAVVVLGDYIDRGFRNFQPVLDVLSELRAPVWPVLGNHDFCVNDDYSCGRIDEVLALLGLTRDSRYRYIDLAGTRFVILDTNEKSVMEAELTGERAEDIEARLAELNKSGVENAFPWNGEVGNEQLAWAKDVIDEAKVRNMRVVVFGHHQIWPDHPDSALNSAQVRDVLSANENVVAYINGHNHHGDFGVYQDMPCVTVEGIIEGDDNAWGILELTDDTLRVQGFGRVTSREEPLRSQS